MTSEARRRPPSLRLSTRSASSTSSRPTSSGRTSPEARSAVRGLSPVILAVVANHGKALRLLLHNKADANLNSAANKRSALHYTAIITSHSSERTAFAKQLIDNGADINARDSNGLTPLMWAVKMYNKEVAKMLIERGADQSLLDNFGKSALSYVSEHSTPEKFGFTAVTQ